MALNVALSDLITRVRDRGEINDNYTDDTELLHMMNTSLADLHRLIVETNPDWYLSSDDVNIVSGTGEYSLPADFYLGRGCDILDNSGDWVNLRQFNWGDRNKYQNTGADRNWTRYAFQGANLYLRPTPGWTQTAGVKIWYVATPYQWTSTSDATTWDTLAGFDEWIILNVCVMHCAKEESDPSVFAAQQGRVENQIRTMITPRDVEEFHTVRDVYSERSADQLPNYWRP